MTVKRNLVGAAVALAAFIGVAGAAHAIDRTGGDYNTIYAGIGIKGYDPVAYFTDGKPVMGKGEFEAFWEGVTWNFASAEHRDLFKADPVKHAPQYGAFCSWGVSQGQAVRRRSGQRLEDRRWQALSQLQQGHSGHLEQGTRGFHREGRGQLADAQSMTARPAQVRAAVPGPAKIVRQSPFVPSGNRSLRA